MSAEDAAATSDQPDLLLCTATMLAHMAQSQLAEPDGGNVQSGHHSQSSDSTSHLGLMLSLLVYIGGLCCNIEQSSDQADLDVNTEPAGATNNLRSAEVQAGERDSQQQGQALNVTDGSQSQQREVEQQQRCQDICLQVCSACAFTAYQI